MKLSILGKIIDFLFPRYCAICEARLLGSEELICTPCLLDLPYTDTWQKPSDNEMTKMFWHQIPIERCAALFHYKSHAPSAQLIYRLKYGSRPEIGIYLGKLMAQQAIKYNFLEGIDAIIPIPLSKSRLHTRGYNQSALIAQGLASLTHLPIIDDAVTRTSFLESQTHKNRWQRQDNVSQVFRCSQTYHDGEGKHPISQLAGKHLLLIDDVCTTGATIIRCCQELMKAGNIKISILTAGWAKP